MSTESLTLSTPTQYVTAANGVRFAYRLLGQSPSLARIPLVMHIHFRGNMDFWDPTLLDPLAAVRPILIFDQAGVGRSSGVASNTIQGWANNVLALLDALELTKIDLLGFSMGGFAAQQIALTRPGLVRRLILAGTGASIPGPEEDGRGIVWPREEKPMKPYLTLRDAKATEPKEVEHALAFSFFTHDEQGRKACRDYRERVSKRHVHGEPNILEFLGPEGTKRQARASLEWATFNPRNSFSRLGELKMPVLISNGDNDLLIPTSRSWEMFKRIDDAVLKIYPRCGHGFLWEVSSQFARDINHFLEDWPESSRSKL